MTTAHLTHVVMSDPVEGLRVVITRLGTGEMIVRATAKLDLLDMLQSLTGKTDLQGETGQQYGTVRFTATQDSYGDVVRSVRTIYGADFVLGVPQYVYNVHATANHPNYQSSPFVVTICDLVPGDHRRIQIITQRGHAANLARNINAAMDQGRIDRLTAHRVVADTRDDEVINLTLATGTNYLEQFRLLLEQMTS